MVVADALSMTGGQEQSTGGVRPMPRKIANRRLECRSDAWNGGSGRNANPDFRATQKIAKICLS